MANQLADVADHLADNSPKILINPIEYSPKNFSINQKISKNSENHVPHVKNDIFCTRKHNLWIYWADVNKNIA